MKCPICNHEVTYASDKCPHCKYDIPRAGLSTHHPDAYQYYLPNPYDLVDEKNKKAVYYSDLQSKPITPWGYIGYGLLYMIPLVGFIFALTHALSEWSINRRNYARSFLLGLLLTVLLVGVAVGVIVTLISFGVLEVPPLPKF